MKKIKVLVGLFLMSGILMTTACSKKGGEETSTKADTTAAAEAPKKQTVTIELAKAENVDQLEEITATVKAEAKNDIASQAPGRIIKINCEVGDFVQKGQLLVKMDPTNLLQTKSQLANYQTDYNRMVELQKAGGASQQAVDQLKLALDIAKETYNNLLENVELKAPISGVITARNYDSGDMYRGANAIVTINQISPVKVIVNVSEDNFGKIKIGQKVSLKVDTYEDKVFSGHVSIIYPTIDAASRTFAVEVTIPNADRKVRPGMFARVTFNYGTKKHVLVPDVAVQKQLGSGDHYVYTYADGKVKYCKVKTGRRVGDKYEIIEGVEDKSYVVTSAVAKLNDGKEVEVIKK